MKTLILLRHAKSSWADPDQSDFARPLSKRGERDAPRMGAWLAAGGHRPQLLLCSAAARTKATLDHLPGTLVQKATIKRLKSLYLADAGRLLRQIRSTPASIETLLIIGHNPGIQELAVQCLQPDAGEPRSAAADAALAKKFPTAAAAIVTFEVRTWAAIAPHSGLLEAFMTPGLLPNAKLESA